MESKITEILQNLHQYQFADCQQIIVELRHYLHDYSHTESDLAFISSKIFNSNESLLEFLRKNVGENDKLIAGIKKRIYELIIEYSRTRAQQLATYLPEIKETCMRSFVGDANSLVKESALQLLLRIIDHYNIDMIHKILKPRELINRLLDEIKLRRPSASVKGTIWNLVGVLHKKFGAGLREFIIESQDQMYRELKQQLESQKPEFRTIIGVIKGLSFSLEDHCTLEQDEIEGLFVRIKTAMQPIPDVRQKGVQKCAMKLFTAHVELFKNIIPRHAEQMVGLTLQLCVDIDIAVRDAANDMLGRLMQIISHGLTVDESIHKGIFERIIGQFKDILDDPNNNIQLISAIKAIGVFSKAIKIFMSQGMLLKYLERLIELSEFKLIKEFENQKNPEEDVQNFKYILKKQKQLITYIESYSYILVELDEAPTETVLTHFFKVCTIGVSNHRKLFESYKHRFYEALASLVMSLSQHKQQFQHWIHRFVRKTLQETLKIPDAAIFGGESPEESLKDAIQFWKEWLNKHSVWSQFTCRIVYDELVLKIVEDIKDLNLSYRMKKLEQKHDESADDAQMAQANFEDTDEALEKLEGTGMLTYHANNHNHQQYLKRIADFLEIFVPQCHDRWILKWVPQLSDTLIKKSIDTPRVPRIYQILRTLMQICNKYKYFDRIKSTSHGQQYDEDDGTIDLGEKINVFNRLLSYFKDLIGKSEEFQDELLLGCIDLLLQVPLALLYSKETGTDNVELWKGVMLKALELGQINKYIAMICINMLEEWFNALPPNTTVKLYQEILPKLSDYLNEDSESGPNAADKSEFYHQRVLEKETEFGRQKVSRKEISNKVLDLLGKIGGYAHNIINNELSKRHDKKNFIRWDPEKRLKFTLPLYNRKIDIYLDSCLPRIVDLAENSSRKDIRIAACEFLHSLIIYMIGKNAQRSQNKLKNNRKGTSTAANQIQEQKTKEEMAAFAKLYAKLFPVIIKLATEAELISRQLFEPLCYQIVRWFSSSKIYEHPEVESLLDSLIEGAQNKNNTSLRQLCSNAVAEFAKWSLKQMSDEEIAHNPSNMKSLIRRIQSNSRHPDPFKRLSSVLCFNKIFSVIREFDPLIDRFCLEICFSVLSSLKMSYEKMELSHEVIETSVLLIPKIEKVILRKWNMLVQQNDKRIIFPDLQTMMIYIFEKFKSFETIYRRESIKLWENLVTKGPPSANLKIPNDYKRWIRDYYSHHRSEKSILLQIQEIDFNQKKADSYKQDAKQDETLRKNKLVLKRKQLDQLTAQLEFMHWLLTKGQFTLSELTQLQFKSSAISKNVNSFLKNVVQKTFGKKQALICHQVIICKEDRELLTKSQIVVLTQIFNLLNQALETVISQGGDQQLVKWIGQCLDGLESGMCASHSQKSSEEENQLLDQQFFLELAIYLVLLPQVFKLQLLVEDQELESSLRSQAVRYLENSRKSIEIYGEAQDQKQIGRIEKSSQGFIKLLIEQKLSKNMSILSLKNIQAQSSNIYSPRLLMNMCLGYLKLTEIDTQLKGYLINQFKDITKDRNLSQVKKSKASLKDVIEEWLQGDSPFENESARVLVKFFSKLTISNQVLLEWLTQKTAIYLKCSDILLGYIAEKWSEAQSQQDNNEDVEIEVEEDAESQDDEDQILSCAKKELQLSQSQTNQKQGATSPQQIGCSQMTMDMRSQNPIEEEESAPEISYSCLGEYLIAKIVRHQSILYSLFIPIIEQISKKDETQNYKRILIKYIPEYCKLEIKHEYKDVAINQIKVFGLIANKAKELLMDSSSLESQSFIKFLIDKISAFLKEKFSVYVKKEVFNLISIVSNLPVGQSQTFSDVKLTVFEKLEPSLKYVQKMHFPVKSRDLQQNSNEQKNFQVIIEAYLNMAIITKNLKILRLLYGVIREHKTCFEQTLKNTLNIIVTQQINTLPKQEFIDACSGFLSDFQNRSLDQSIDDNIRWAIAKKIMVRIFETCSQEKLVDLVTAYNSEFMNILRDTKFEEYHFDSPHEFYNLVKEKTYIMVFYEIVYRRLPVKTVKEVIHQRLYGENSAQNELTKFLSEYAAKAKREPIKGFDEICKDFPTDKKGTQIENQQLETHFIEINSQKAVQTQYCCAAYSLLSSVIVCTQSNEAAFATFLFNAKQGNTTHSMWTLIIENQVEFLFSVQTNFNYVELKNIEQKLAESTEKNQNVDFAGQRIQNMMNEYLTSSFMSANEKFNQNMVFETQFDQSDLKKEEQAFQEIFNKKYNPYQKSQPLASQIASTSQDSSQGIVQNEIEAIQLAENLQTGNFIPEEESQFELDHVNRHQCMKNIKRCIERMKMLFGEEWKANPQQMPKFGHYLLEEFQQTETHINIKIFILKIVTNNPKLFKPHAALWFEPICEYIICKNNGGKGFHYFLRDVCTMLISWDFMPPDTSKIKMLLTKVINSLILIAADGIKLIFKQNVKIISTLMEKWKSLICINKVVIAKMISIQDSEPQSHLWKMNAIEILALAVCYDIPVLMKIEDVQSFSTNQHKFQLVQNVQNQAGRIDPLLLAILKIFESKKKQIIYATSELLGMILNNQKDQPHFSEIIKHTKAAIFANEIRERHDVFVYSIERVSREYHQLMSEREIFLKTMGFINILTGQMRAAVFKTFERYIKVAKRQGNLKDICDIAMSLVAVFKDVLSDINDDNQQSFLSLLIVLSELKGVDSVEKLLDLVVPQLKSLFVQNKNEYSRGLFYDLMVNLYDKYEAYKNHESVKGSLIHGLSDSSKMIKDKLAKFWDDQNRLELDPLVRLQQLMDIMYINDEENAWLTNAAFLLLQVSTRSSDFDRKIFEEPLQECQFAPMHLNTMNPLGIMNRSQPMTPLFTQIDQMIQDSQNNQEITRQQQQQIKKEKDQQNETFQLSQNYQDVQFEHQNQNQIQNLEQGFVRATQLPQFTQTQVMQSSLIAGISRYSIVQGTLTDSFYGVNNPHVNKDKSSIKGNKPMHQGGVKGGTQLFTINEEVGGDDDGGANLNSPSQDSDGFIAPAPRNRKNNTIVNKFFKKIDFLHRPMEVTEGQKIRFVHQATMPSHLARQEEIRRMQRQQFVDRQIKQRKNQVSLYRQYRIGELPDIQIDFKDVIMPLMAVVRADSTIATEIFVEIFQEIYKEQKDKEVRNKLGLGLKNILSSSKIFDYSTMNCAHRIAIELLKIDGFIIDADVIERTGERSMSFQTSLILLEESLIRGNFSEVQDLENESSVQNEGNKRNIEKLTNQPYLHANKNKMYQVTNKNRHYWFKLIKLYEIIGNQDALHGVWCELAQQNGVMFKTVQTGIEEKQNQSFINSQEEEMNPNRQRSLQDQEHVVNLIKYVQELKNKGRIEAAWKEMENTLNNKDFCKDFEDQIKLELENKKFEYMSELLKWDSIATELNYKNQNMQLYEITSKSGFKQVDTLIRSQIRSERHWENLSNQINNWMKDDYSKNILEKNFSYELSMFFLTQLDYDRARIYIEREASELLSQWKNLTKLSQVAQHFLVQKIQKIYETKEFLNLIKNDYSKDTSLENQMESIVRSIINWKHRSPSESFDPLSVWEDIATARQFYIDHYCMRFNNTPLHQAITGKSIQISSQDNFKNLKEDLVQIQDIQVMMHIQTAKGAFKMRAYDASNRYLKLIQTKRNPNSTNDMRIIVPIIKLKTEQSKPDLRNMGYEQRLQKIEKIYEIFVKKMDQNQFDLTNLLDKDRQQNISKETSDYIESQLKQDHGFFDHLGQHPSFESIKTLIKSNLLKYSLQKKLLSVILDESQSEKSIQSLQNYSQNTVYYLKRCFNSLEHIQAYLSAGCVLNTGADCLPGSQGGINHRGATSQQQQSYEVHQKGKVLFRLAKFSDKLLRKMQKGESGPQILLNQGLKAIGKSERALAKMTIQNGLQALKIGYLRASDIIPRMLDVLGEYKEDVKDEYVEHSKNTPAWLFLRWISQIAAVLNRPESSIIQDTVSQIASKYPQALFYPFKVIESNLEINFMEVNNRFSQHEENSQVFMSLRQKFLQFEILNKWVEALDCLIFPEQRFKYWFQIVCDTTQDPSMQHYYAEATQKGGSTSSLNPLLQKVRQLVLLMHSDIMTKQKPKIGQEIGEYNRQFIEKWAATFEKSFGVNGGRVLKMSFTELVTQLQNINKKMSTVQLFQGSEMISKYSEWMDQLDCNEFYQVRKFIEIPGQYENKIFIVEPSSSKNVKIANFKKVCLVLGSIRRPKKVIVHGSNEKDYQLLIKGGEDLRLDQRVQQLFGIMNRIFSEDPVCENRNLNLKTFKVIPITNRLGSLEWVDNTEPMKALISKEHQRLEGGADINSSRAFKQRMNWLAKLPGNKSLSNPTPAQLHLELLKLDQNEVVRAFKEHQAAMPFYLLRNALENLCLTSSAFLTIKNQFIKSMAVFSVCSYLIGIGDRHLENFLVDITDGEVLGIDFGIAFGSNINLSIPELMPFRLTQQIEGVIAPHPLEGIYKQTMVHVLNAMRKKKSLILDACEIFVKEPLLDWVKHAKQRNRGQKADSSSALKSGDLGEKIDQYDGHQGQDQYGQAIVDMVGRDRDGEANHEGLISWYPRQKIETLRDKLQGINPIRILASELKDSLHESKTDYIKQLRKAIQGPEDSIRYHHLSQNRNKKYADVEDQVDILIELARDPNILGRTWIGWSPQI